MKTERRQNDARRADWPAASDIRENSRRLSFIFYILTVVVLVVTIGALIFFKLRVNEVIKSTEPAHPLETHYAFICKNSSDSFYRAVYDSASEEGEKLGCSVEFMGQDLSTVYSRNERMKIATGARVDGIIVEADESDEMTELIAEATGQGIPVVTIGSDCTGSSRQSFVGAGFYALGQMYGEKILADIPEGRDVNVLVLVSPNENDTNQNIIYGGIQDTLNRSRREDIFTIGTEAVNAREPFEAEEKISDLIRNTDKLPDVVVCLDELNTSCIYQALINYNRVGETRVYGYYIDESILSGIENKVISATAVVDAEEMGRYSVDALNEYSGYGIVNEYMPVDIELVDSSNVNRYKGE